MTTINTPAIDVLILEDSKGLHTVVIAGKRTGRPMKPINAWRAVRDAFTSRVVVGEIVDGFGVSQPYAASWCGWSRGAKDVAVCVRMGARRV